MSYFFLQIRPLPLPPLPIPIAIGRGAIELWFDEVLFKIIGHYLFPITLIVSNYIVLYTLLIF